LTLPSTPSPFNAPPPTQIYTLSLHDALPIYDRLMPLASRDYTFSYLLPAEASGLTLKTRVRYHILTDAQHNALKKEYGLTAEDPYAFTIYERDYPLSGNLAAALRQGEHDPRLACAVDGRRPG